MKDEKWYDVYDIRKELRSKGVEVGEGKVAYETFRNHGYEFDFQKFKWRKQE